MYRTPIVTIEELCAVYDYNLIVSTTLNMSIRFKRSDQVKSFMCSNNLV